ncbi:MAG: site-specific DNA-methyltransferase [Kiritimatiellae bacterium]|jgi:DNA modification methylase|nr:site-specific DNA-methyltransferase [Kiritimatiellia bacterium]MDD2347415.1 DNA methyltransferase [Kiritimatiellia bacterium]MDD3584132.1 DNA methyltransferase [Kiritimatiellia bacterium]HHU14692.1 site-specific DNA-methyltransferase [Lentisphaerota bacterium]HON48168.1 DNA methyltransferase [Kiritimatiellia bacterium]
MSNPQKRLQPGRVRDAIINTVKQAQRPLSVKEIVESVRQTLGDVPTSSIRSYLRLNTPDVFVRESRGYYSCSFVQPELIDSFESVPSKVDLLTSKKVGGNAILYHADCFDWLARQSPNSIHAIVTDPPYGLFEYSEKQITKLRSGRGGVWRIPPSFDGHMRSPLPRFTVLSADQLQDLRTFFTEWGRTLLPRLVPGANVIVASNPLLSYIVSDALASAGLERRGEIVRLTMTMRGGDRPKAAHEEFSCVSVMPRSMWEPWLVYRKPVEGRVQDNLRKWGTGGFRRPEKDKPFGDVIASAPTRKAEREIAPHPSLKPQAFLRQLVRAALPLGKGVVVDTFAGSGSTLAAAEAVGYESIGIEKDETYFNLACKAIRRLAAYEPSDGTFSSSSRPQTVNPVSTELRDAVTM